ncbi:hypothetical protein [Thermosipho sp. 1074]|uniref:hypothetical protein n=1 Tax=Thermosipho sp. 1074 TaxID=1643331 RepID=UPI000984385A|nr:hypothetical protein [Thermosipho sp. 1074]OOC42169.1 hypothetical protein XO08_07745 [Thermosipho sp. 1074]
MESYEEFLKAIDEVIKKVPFEEREPIKKIFFETWNKTFNQNPKNIITQFIINFQEIKQQFPFIKQYAATAILAEAMTEFLFNTNKEEAVV